MNIRKQLKKTLKEIDRGIEGAERTMQLATGDRLVQICIGKAHLLNARVSCLGELSVFEEDEKKPVEVRAWCNGYGFAHPKCTWKHFGHGSEHYFNYLEEK